MWLRVLILLAGICFFPMKSYAVSCTVSPTTNISFGTPNPLSTTDILTSVQPNYRCVKGLDILSSALVCFNIAAGSNGATDPRRMTSGANTLNYQLYQNAGRTIVWGNLNTANFSAPSIRWTLLNLELLETSGTLTLYAKIPGGQTSVIPGSYQEMFTTGTATITIKFNPSASDTTCGTQIVGSFAFNVSATVNKQCNVSVATDVNLGPVPHTQTNTQGTTSFGTTCTNTTAYSIGLSPSNNSTTGSGVMKSKSNSATNTDLVPYQLNSTAGVGGTPWGSLAPNTVAGTGTGLAVNRTVYVVAPSANYRPDDYTDTVTINVTY